MMDPDMMGGEFGQLIQQAAKLKGAQMAKDKRRFETWPKYLQHTMYNQEKLAEIRALPAAERLERASALKDEGNELVKEGRHDDAMGVYEKALGVYYYVHNREPEWKTKGINDADVKIVDEAAEDSGEEIAQQVRQLKLSVLLNISLAAQHAQDQGLVARACTDALKLDSTNSKALCVRPPLPPGLAIPSHLLRAPACLSVAGGERLRTGPWVLQRSSTWRLLTCALPTG